MKLTKVMAIDADSISFDNGFTLTSDHEQDCCENHYLDLSHLTLADFDGLEFDLSSDDFFERIEDYGIRLVPKNGHRISIPGYGYNNGYYSTNLTLVLSGVGFVNRFNITSCQVIKD